MHQDELTIDDNGRPSRPNPPNRAFTDHGNRKENQVPRGPPTHRPSRSQEQTNGIKRVPVPNGGNGISRPRQEELDIFADGNGGPQVRSPERRVRRNSDSSVMDRKSIDDEKRKQERRRRKEREAQDLKDGKVPKKPSRKLDIIDQLDATSIFGTGCEYNSRDVNRTSD